MKALIWILGLFLEAASKKDGLRHVGEDVPNLRPDVKVFHRRQVQFLGVMGSWHHPKGLSLLHPTPQILAVRAKMMSWMIVRAACMIKQCHNSQFHGFNSLMRMNVYGIVALQLVDLLVSQPILSGKKRSPDGLAGFCRVVHLQPSHQLPEVHSKVLGDVIEASLLHRGYRVG